MNTRQIDLEEQSHKEAVAKRRRELQEAKEKGYMSGGTTEGRQLFINLFLPFAEDLRRRLDEAMSGKASKWAQFANHTHQLSEELGIEYIAYCAMKKMIDRIDSMCGSSSPTESSHSASLSKYTRFGPEGPTAVVMMAAASLGSAM